MVKVFIHALRLDDSETLTKKAVIGITICLSFLLLTINLLHPTRCWYDERFPSPHGSKTLIEAVMVVPAPPGG